MTNDNHSRDAEDFAEWAPVLDTLHALELVRHQIEQTILHVRLAPDPVTASGTLAARLKAIASLATVMVGDDPAATRLAIAAIERSIGLSAQARTRGTALALLGDILAKPTTNRPNR